MQDPIVIERKANGRLAPVEGDERSMRVKDQVMMQRHGALAQLDLRITFQGRSPFSLGPDGHSFSYGELQTVVRDFAAGGDNRYKYKCHPNGQPPGADDGGEIIIEPGG